MISFQVSLKSEILAAFTDIIFEILFKSYFDVKVLKICSSLNTPWNQNNNKAAGGPNRVTSALSDANCEDAKKNSGCSL